MLCTCRPSGRCFVWYPSEGTIFASQLCGATPRSSFPGLTPFQFWRRQLPVIFWQLQQLILLKQPILGQLILAFTQQLQQSLIQQQ